ncbi:contractile injection system tape measure protein [Pedobacter miscanthi]|uniref:Uncharacterized protein n=1 Tax=Pedobacter miscanthi TaxID=2259170 RepID=A0A366LC94_9SPHI|nr:contractile injection system tape measure protein [Pedobacter miscanthi]RBQ11400.1 hypothetical protein DRW42_02745 [Pedobacter miscanthi]
MEDNIKQDLLKDAIAVRNAGIVLLNNYVLILFERLGLTEDRRFLNSENQLAAVHYLQYLVTGQNHTEESFLSLNKVLCGISLSQSLKTGIEISSEHQNLMDSLLHAAINAWPAIGNSLVDGFRGNWLVRDGMLTEKEDKWELVVEKRPYDLLINKSPFSFSVIKYPWMDKPLYVTWPY